MLLIEKDMREAEIKRKLLKGQIEEFDPTVLQNLRKYLMKKNEVLHIYETEDSISDYMSMALFEKEFFEQYILPYGKFDPTHPAAIKYHYEIGLISKEEYEAFRQTEAYAEYQEEQKERYAAYNRQRSAPSYTPPVKTVNVPKCPICGSTNLSKISAGSKFMSGLVFGLFAAGDMSKTWKCNHCGSKF